MPIRRLPYPAWLLFVLRPLNNKHTWRLRLAILRAMDPPWFSTNLTESHMKSKKRPPMPGKGGKKPC